MTKLTHEHTTQSVNSTVLDSSVLQIESSIMIPVREYASSLLGPTDVFNREVSLHVMGYVQIVYCACTLPAEVTSG